MDVVTELRKRNGIARTRTLMDAGVSAYALRQAKKKGTVIRPRNGWVALPDAPIMIEGTVRRGARRRSAARVPHPGAEGRSRALGEADRSAEPGCCGRRSAERAVAGGAVPAVLAQARPFADSGLETIFVHRLGWLRIPMLPQAWVVGHRVDLLIGERLVIQIDGATHTGVQRTSDIEHDALLKLRGYHVLRFSYEQIMEHWETVQAIVTEAIAQGLHLAER